MNALRIAGIVVLLACFAAGSASADLLALRAGEQAKTAIIGDPHAQGFQGLLRGAGTGLLAGVAIGAFVAFMVDPEDDMFGTAEDYRAAITVGLGLIGFTIGGIGGLVTSGAQQVDPPQLPQLSMGLTPSPDRALMIAASYRFLERLV